MITIDGFFLKSQEVKYFNNVSQVDTDCEIILLKIFTGSYHHYNQIIDQIKPRGRKILIWLTEPITEGLEKFVARHRDDRVSFFGDTVLNFKYDNFFTSICWFVSPINYYKEHEWAITLLYQVDTQSIKPLKFDCLLGRQKPERELIDAMYQASPAKDQIFFTYYRSHSNFSSQGSWNGIGNTTQTNSDQPLTISGSSVPISAVISTDIYNQTQYSIVAETTSFNEHTMFTEKVAKPMLAKRLFVAFAGQHYLRNLRSLGFRTFGDVINEGYDSIADRRQRFSEAWRQVELLCDADVGMIQEKIKDIVDHNHKVMLETDWLKDLRRHFPDLDLDRLW